MNEFYLMAGNETAIAETLLTRLEEQGFDVGYDDEGDGDVNLYGMRPYRTSWHDFMVEVSIYRPGSKPQDLPRPDPNASQPRIWTPASHIIVRVSATTHLVDID